MDLSTNEIMDFAEGVSKFYFNKYDEIDPKLIAYHNGITFTFNDYGTDFDGMLEYRNSLFHIYINTYGSESYLRRATFTFGHELGHFFLPHHSNAIASGQIKAHLSHVGYKSTLLMEKEADLFCSCLLMPEFLIKKLYSKFRKFDTKIFTQIAESFNVSPLASIYRFLQINFHPIMIVRSVSNRIDKITGRSKDFYYKLYNTTQLPEDSLASNFFRTRSMKLSSKKLWVLDWFDKDTSKEMYEYCIYYPNQDMVYSVLWVD